MAFQVLSRKWRPKKFQDVVGQEHVTRSLRNAITRDRLGHAYILTGTRGIGKTSVARIFAKALRCLNRHKDGNPCGECEACNEFESGSAMNVMEIDGASNNSVDDIRELISRVQTLPTFGKYKVYIIDEVHMLSTSAFNALLKTLEEPPSHVIFLLATTEPHKLLSTVLSRCQRFDFRNASVETLIQHLTYICEQESLKLTNPRLLRTVAIQAKGSFRDSLSLLDQVISFANGEEINGDVISMALGLAKTSSIKNLLKGVFEGKVHLVSASFQEMLHENVNLSNICESTLNYLYDLISHMDDIEVLELDEEFNKVFNELNAQELFWIYETLAQDWEWSLKSITPEKVVEVTLQKVALRRTFFFQHNPIKPSEIKANGSVETLVEKPQEKSEEKPVEKIEIPLPKPESLDEEQNTLQGERSQKVEEPVINKENFSRDWIGFIEYVKEISPAMASNLEQGNLSGEMALSSEALSIDVGFRPSGKVFVDYLSESEVFQKIQKHLGNFFDVPVEKVHLNLVFVKPDEQEEGFQTRVEIEEIKERDIKEERESKIIDDPLIQEATNIFGTGIDKIKLND